MLVSPLGPPRVFPEDTTQYRPAKDLEAFNSLLPPPIEFIEGSSSGALAIPEGKYQPINGTPKASTVENPCPPSVGKPLYVGPLLTSWPNNVTVGSGLHNTGNTCFLNSALQCLLHTPPLMHILQAHGIKEPCAVQKGTFCMSCGMRQVMVESFSNQRSMTPYPITNKLQIIAKHMRRGRQEDSHEFLRYAIDALQKSCLAGHPPKLDPKIAETTWVHKIFGGRLRSRVTCLDCGHNSDTFDSILDLSVDIYGVAGLKDALRKFVTIDHLKGADKYKCEKCKKAVTADKQFTLHEAPLVLTMHLKRFSPMGRKIGHLIKYDDHLSLQPIMSEGQHGPTYSLYGVISHAGGGPNSGHYYAHVKSANGQWYEMNDDLVTRQSGVPTSLKNAYMLFYIRDKGQALEAAMRAPPSTPTSTSATIPSFPRKTGLVAGMRKRNVIESEDEDVERPATKKPTPFIGPVLPSTAALPETPKSKSRESDPQAKFLKKKIAAVSQSPVAALQSLAQYDEEDDDKGTDADVAMADAPPPPSTAPAPLPATPAPSAVPVRQASSSTIAAPVPVTSFYGASGNNSASKKRKSPDRDDDDALGEWARTRISPGLPSSSPMQKERRQSGPKYTGGNPFSSRLTGSNNLQQHRDPGTPKYRYGRRKARMIM
ncbi:cysteine proteinase [Amylocystis lapponica]|nr:cysteine proteinase [Amylocystis lapponica]